MIRITKTTAIPPSLLRVGNTKHDGQDVQDALIEDHKEKCYLCERICITDYQIEHLKSQANNDHLKTDWNNLFFSCGYCNGKKKHYFDEILDPTQSNVEDIIIRDNDWAIKKVTFNDTSGAFTISNNKTIELLTRIFNGTGVSRVIKEERFYEYYLSRMNVFRESLKKYLNDKSQENKNAIIEELQIDKEFLAFKYHILRKNVSLYNDFKQYTVWNKN